MNIIKHKLIPEVFTSDDVNIFHTIKTDFCFESVSKYYLRSLEHGLLKVNQEKLKETKQLIVIEICGNTTVFFDNFAVIPYELDATSIYQQFIGVVNELNRFLSLIEPIRPILKSMGLYYFFDEQNRMKNRLMPTNIINTYLNKSLEFWYVELDDFFYVDIGESYESPTLQSLILYEKVKFKNLNGMSSEYYTDGSFTTNFLKESNVKLLKRMREISIEGHPSFVEWVKECLLDVGINEYVITQTKWDHVYLKNLLKPLKPI